MRRDGIPYVPNPSYYKVPKDYKDMDLQELKTTYIKTCAKSHNSLAVCAECAGQCEYGRRALELIGGNITNDKDVPLYDGMTLLQKAQEENRKRREQMEETNTVSKVETKTLRGRPRATWYEESTKAENQVAWTMEKFGITELQAKRKLASFRYNHGLTKAKAEKNSDICSKIKQLEAIVAQKTQEIREYEALLDTATNILNEAMTKLDVLRRANKIMQGE